MRIGKFEPLALKKEVTFLSKHGEFIRAAGFSVKYVCTEKSKVAFVIRKKVAIAPKRNLLKRRIRAIIAKYDPKHAAHVLIIAKQSAMLYSFDRLRYEIDFLFEKIQRACSFEHEKAHDSGN